MTSLATPESLIASFQTVRVSPRSIGSPVAVPSAPGVGASTFVAVSGIEDAPQARQVVEKLPASVPSGLTVASTVVW